MYRVSESLRATHGQDGAVALDIHQGQVFQFNLVGSKIVEFLRNGSSESEIAQRISREFGIDQDLAQKDLRDFLQTLKKYHLIEGELDQEPSPRSPTAWD